MNIFETDRDVLPIWVSSAEAAKTPELSVIKLQKKTGEFTTSAPLILAEFEASSSVGVAIELLNSAIIEGEQNIAIRAAEFLLDKQGLPPSVQKLVREQLGLKEPKQDEMHANAIARLRARIKSGGNDPLAWVDLSREYAILGDKERSQRSMLVAYQMCTGHRWISRVAARAFVHFNEPEKAYDLIKRNPEIRNDPWLVATEMAVSRKTKKPTKLWTIAKRLLDSNIKPIHISELASSAATEELASGADKKAKGLFKQSLIDPNQNALAQAKWAERTSSLKKLVTVPLNPKIAAYEAQYWEAYSNKETLKALEFAKAWLKEEPFSSGPPLAISYIAALLDDYELILETTKKGLTANPSNATLRLNEIFAWIATTNFKSVTDEIEIKTESFMRELRSMINGPDWSVAAHASANIGMYLYRIGSLEQGKLRYEAAEEQFEKNAPSLRIMLVVNHLREALIADAPWSMAILNSAHALLERKKSSVTPGSEFYLEKISLITQLPGTWREKFRNKQTISSINEQLNAKYQKPTEEKELSSKFWLPSEFDKTESLREFTKGPILTIKRQRK
jgi:hypothetical protein